MTDLEISKALALAIGWAKRDMRIDPNFNTLLLFRGAGPWDWVNFDYRDWNVIGPIAEWYKCFPQGMCGEWCSRCGDRVAVFADTPQKAIALAVIGAKK